MAIDCLAGYLFSEQKESNTLPVPSELTSIDINAEYEDYEQAFVNMIAVDVEEYAKKHFNKAVKKTLTIPVWLNEKAIEQHINFSQILQEALIERLNINA